MQSNFKSLKNVTKLHYVNKYIFNVYISQYTLIVNNKKNNKQNISVSYNFHFKYF